VPCKSITAAPARPSVCCLPPPLPPSLTSHHRLSVYALPQPTRSPTQLPTTAPAPNNVIAYQRHRRPLPAIQRRHCISGYPHYHSMSLWRGDVSRCGGGGRRRWSKWRVAVVGDGSGCRMQAW
jgi:hypothetical protein